MKAWGAVLFSSILFTSVQKHVLSPGCPHMKWNCPCCLYQDVPLSVLWPKSGKDRLFSPLRFPSFPPSHTNALYLNKHRDAGLSCSIVLFGESRIRVRGFGRDLIRISYGSCPIRWSSVRPSVCHLADYHATLFLSDTKGKQCVALDKWHTLKWSQRFMLAHFPHSFKAEEMLTFSHWAQLLNKGLSWGFN